MKILLTLFILSFSTNLFSLEILDIEENITLIASSENCEIQYGQYTRNNNRKNTYTYNCVCTDTNIPKSCDSLINNSSLANEIPWHYHESEQKAFDQDGNLIDPEIASYEWRAINSALKKVMSEVPPDPYLIVTSHDLNNDNQKEVIIYYQTYGSYDHIGPSACEFEYDYGLFKFYACDYVILEKVNGKWVEILLNSHRDNGEEIPWTSYPGPVAQITKSNKTNNSYNDLFFRYKRGNELYTARCEYSKNNSLKYYQAVGSSLTTKNQQPNSIYYEGRLDIMEVTDDDVVSKEYPLPNGYICEQLHENGSLPWSVCSQYKIDCLD